ncbi:MAG: SHOCT domain-containing protein [Actinomycetota bacterium]|nr:SHOCT domain-containing protein [Actinomycetota bacterium]
MSSRLEDLRELAQLLDEGKITQWEFEVVKTELLEAPIEEWADHQDGDSEPVAHPAIPEEDRQEEPKPAADWMAYAKQIPPLYWASIGCVLVVGVVVAMIISSGSADSVDPQALADSSAESLSDEPPTNPVGSLGVEFADLTEGWNALPDPPFILKGITTSPEVGALDSFVYRFDDAALLAGAYNPSDGFVYALMARVGIRHESRSNVSLHLCYLLYPGTQDCLDTYMEMSGVYGKTPEELAEADHFSSWVFLDNEWRVEVVNEIETIRVLGPLQPPAD